LTIDEVRLTNFQSLNQSVNRTSSIVNAMSEYSRLSLVELLDAFASNAPVPGGGSASALAGAIGASLVIMVAGLPKTRLGTEQERAALDAAATRLRPLRDELAALVDRDSEAYTSVLNAYRLPKSNDVEKAARRNAIDTAMRAATDAPLATMRACERVMREAAVVAERGAAAAASDVAVAIDLLKTAARGAALNVDTNLADVKDADYVGRVMRERRDLAQAIESLFPTRP
jgi:glutamate formiminotransferase/formiminotetrahydrofolate cyclodeaminase